MRVVLVAAALVGLAVAGAPAQEAMKYVPYAFQKGDVTRTTKVEDGSTVTTFSAGGKEQKKDEKRKKTVVYTTRVVHVGSDPTKPEKVVRTYEKAVEVKDGAEAKLDLDGLAVSIERTGHSYTFLAADGTPLPAPVVAELNKEFNKKGSIEDRDLFPKDGAKPGDTWDLTAILLKSLDSPDQPFVPDAAKSKVTGKLLSVTKKGSATVGEIRVTADLPLTELRGKTPIRLNPGSKWTIEMKGGVALDGSNPDVGMTAAMKVAIEGTVQGVNLKVDADVKQSSKTERVTGAKR
jgi:hypothetical protein